MKGTIVYKMTGSGNDFVVLDGRATDAAAWPPARVAQLCHRRTGVGADGLVVLTPEGPGAVRMVYWNSDGSRAAMCGNAALCSARLAVYLELAAPGELCLLTDAGPVRARAAAEGDRAEIGLADFDIPGRADLGLAPGERWMAFATVGVPHLVLAVEDIEAIDLLGRGRALRHDRRLGAAGANVNFVAAPAEAGGPWRIRTYERGVEGETLACGTGTVASGVALAAHGEAVPPVRFISRGGEEMTVQAGIDRGAASGVWLGGQGKLVFRAVWEG
ncbi:MAG TPA: diaminopimelate epimerase [Gemmatimonadales bacterium]|jgi:diaminopimelate epimerase|nr:diaminopimelate epimerase [Gemmatimonadales bacterium]